MLDRILNKARTLSRIATDNDVRAQFFLERSRRSFGAMYDAYWNAVKPDRSITDLPDWHDRMSDDGILIVPDYLSGTKLETARKEAESLKFTTGNYSGERRNINMAADGICAVEANDLPVSWSMTGGNDQLTNLVKSLYGPSMQISSAAILSKYAADRIDSSNVPHWDDWRARIKAFIYLTDVTENDAPTIYVKGTHKTNVPPWRFDKDFASKYLGKAVAGGSWWPVYELKNESVTCTGMAGTLVLFDARGIHAGTQLIKGPRVMLMGMWTTHIPYTFRPF